MDQIRQIGEVLGSLKALMMFRDDISINQRQCSVLLDMFSLAFDMISMEMKQKLTFDERNTKWRVIEEPLRELYEVFREGELYVTQCLEAEHWFAKAIALYQNQDSVELHIHNLLCCISVVVEAIEVAGEISGCNRDEIQRKRVLISEKYDKDWTDPIFFQWKLGKQYLVSQDICNQLGTVWREDRWLLLEIIKKLRSSTSIMLTNHEQLLADFLFENLMGPRPLNGKCLPISVLIGSEDYQVRRQLGNENQYQEIQWLGESFTMRHFSAEIEPLVFDVPILLSLTHPNIMHLFCYFFDEGKKEIFLVMELMNNDLSSYIKEICHPDRKIPFSIPVAVDIMLQIARGMEYLHSQKIYHGDLNPSNILVKKRSSSTQGYLHAKVSGFSLSPMENFTTRNSMNQNGTDPFIWYAPEVLVEQEYPGNMCRCKYTEKADVYSFGMVCFKILTGKAPFEDGHLQEGQMSHYIKVGNRPLFPFPAPKYFTNLAKRCWQTDPSQRPNFSSICRILRYIKRFLVINPDHSHPDPPLPLIDYGDVEAGLMKKFHSWESPHLAPVWQIPFEIYAYRVVEKEKTTDKYVDKSSKSGNDGASMCGDESTSTFDNPLPSLSKNKSSVCSESAYKKVQSKMKYTDEKANKKSGTPEGQKLSHQPLNPCGRNLRMNSGNHRQSVVIRPSREHLTIPQIPR